jgi:prefoldin subunit 5
MNVRQRTSLVAALALVASLSGASLLAQVRDLYVVVDEKVTLYLDRHLQHGNLLVGDVVEGVLSRAKFRESIAQDRASLVSRIERYTDRIDSARAETWELRSAVAAIEFDSSVEFREKTIVPVAPGPPGAGVQPNLKAVYTYRNKVSPSQAKRQAGKWQDDIDGLDKQVDDWESKRRDDVASLAVLDYNRQFFERRFQVYEDNHVSRLMAPYLVTADKANVYDGEQFITQLKSEQIVLGRPNHRSSRWLRVQLGEQVLDARAERLSSRQDVERDALSRLAKLRQYVADLQAGIDLLSARAKQLKSLRVSLQYESRVTRVPLTVYPFEANYPGRTYYLGRSAPRDATQMVDLGRARSVQRDWESRLADIQDSLKRLRRRLDSARRDLALTEAKTDERSRRFRATDPIETR